MLNRLSVFVIILLQQLFAGASLYAQSTLDLFANYHTIGVNVLLSDEDPEMDAELVLSYKTDPDDSFRRGFEMSKADNNFDYYSGSIFWCEPNSTYNVRIEINDPTTAALNGQVLYGEITTKTILESAEPIRTLYVAPDGEGIEFSIDAPGNLQDALMNAVAGDKLKLLAGNYFVGNLTLANSGTAVDPIQIEGELDGSSVLNGAYQTPLTWTDSDGDGVYMAITSANNPNLVIADGVRLFPYQSYPDVKDRMITLNHVFDIREPTGLDGFYRNPTGLPVWPTYGDPAGIANNKLYIKFADGGDPNDKVIEVTKQSRALSLIDRSYISIKNITIKNYGLGSVATALIIEDSESIYIDNCRFENNNSCISLKNRSSNITVTNSVFKDAFINWKAWKIKATVDYGGFSDRFPFNSRNLEKGSFVFGHDFAGRGIVIRGNTFSDYHQAGVLSPSPPTGFDTDLDTDPHSLEIDFYENTIERVSGDGFEVEGITRNIRVFKNQFDSVHVPLSMALAEEGPVYVLRNTFSNMVADTFNYDNVLSRSAGNPIKFQFGSGEPIRTGDLFIFHNTFDAQEDAYAANYYQVSIANAWKRIVVENNIFQSNDRVALNVKALNTPNLFSDYNGYFSTGSNIARIDTNNTGGVTYGDIDKLLAPYGWDKNSFEAEADFVDRVGGDYHLNETSPMIDRGKVIVGINENDYTCDAPDIGAFEFICNLKVVNNNSTSSLLIYPNPIQNGQYLNLMTDEDLIGAQFKLIDMKGRIMFDEIVITNQINLPSLATGVYFAELYFNEVVLTEKIIVY